MSQVSQYCDKLPVFSSPDPGRKQNTTLFNKKFNKIYSLNSHFVSFFGAS